MPIAASVAARRVTAHREDCCVRGGSGQATSYWPLAGTVVLLGALDAKAGAEIVFVPMLLIGLRMGALASQVGSVTVSAVPDEESPEVGGVHNAMTYVGASLGTALDACGDARIAGLRSALAILNPLAIVALFLAQRIPSTQPGPSGKGSARKACPERTRSRAGRAVVGIRTRRKAKSQPTRTAGYGSSFRSSRAVSRAARAPSVTLPRPPRGTRAPSPARPPDRRRRSTTSPWLSGTR